MSSSDTGLTFGRVTGSGNVTVAFHTPAIATLLPFSHYRGVYAATELHRA